MPTQVRRTPRHLRNLAWQVTHELDQRIGRLTRGWPDEQQGRGQDLRRLVMEAADHIAVGSDVGEAHPFRRQLAKAIQKLGLVHQIWRLMRSEDVVEAEEWEDMERLRDRAERLTRGLYLALGRQIKEEASTLKGMCR